MTALQIYVRADVVHILTDGLHRHPDGEISHVAQKVRILGVLPAAVVGRGPTELPEYFADLANSRFESFDQAVTGLADTWREAVRNFETAYPGARSAPNFGALAGYSAERDRPECWIVDTQTGGEPAQVMNTCAPSSPELMGKLAEMGLTRGLARFDPETDGLRIMRAQRDLQFPHPISGVMQQAVGGLCQLTSVSKDGVSTRILERWPTRQAA